MFVKTGNGTLEIGPGWFPLGWCKGGYEVMCTTLPQRRVVVPVHSLDEEQTVMIDNCQHCPNELVCLLNP